MKISELTTESSFRDLVLEYVNPRFKRTNATGKLELLPTGFEEVYAEQLIQLANAEQLLARVEAMSPQEYAEFVERQCRRDRQESQQAERKLRQYRAACQRMLALLHSWRPPPIWSDLKDDLYEAVARAKRQAGLQLRAPDFWQPESWSVPPSAQQATELIRIREEVARLQKFLQQQHAIHSELMGSLAAFNQSLDVQPSKESSDPHQVQ
jgi:hypothetical protein